MADDTAGHRHRHAGGQRKTDRQIGEPAHRQMGEALGLDRISPQPDRVGIDDGNASARFDRRHDRRIVPAAATDDQPFGPRRQKIEGPADGAGGPRRLPDQVDRPRTIRGPHLRR